MNVAEIKDFIQQYGIGLTGGIATGKTTVAGIIGKLGYAVIDADEMARRASAKGSAGLAQIAEKFGENILRPDGNLDRKKLGALIFDDRKARLELEKILHPLIAAELAKAVVELNLVEQKKFFFYEASLLFETGTQDRFREIWSTVCSPETQLARLQSRNNIDRATASKIISSQLPAAEKALRSKVVIDTEGDHAQLIKRVQTALKKLV